MTIGNVEIAGRSEKKENRTEMNEETHPRTKSKQQSIFHQSKSPFTNKFSIIIMVIIDFYYYY